MSLFDLWLASRMPQTGEVTESEDSDGKSEVRRTRVPMVPGSRRPLTVKNVGMAYRIVQSSSVDLFRLMWRLDKSRTTCFVLLTLVRGLLPAFRGWSQALILDEVGACEVRVTVVCSRLWL